MNNSKDEIVSIRDNLLAQNYCQHSADILKWEEFVEKILGYKHAYNSNKQSEIRELASNVGITIKYKTELRELVENPLHFLCQKNKPEILNTFLLRGTDIEARSSIFSTPLHTACLYSNIECVRVLLYHGADTTACNVYNQIPLMVGILTGSREIIDELFPYIDEYVIDNICCKGKTLLIRFVIAGMTDYALCLLEMHPDVNVRNSYGSDALYWSFQMKDPRCFNEIFPRVTDLTLLDGLILSFFRHCKFSKSDFEASLFKIHSSPHIDYIINDCRRNLRKSLFKLRLGWTPMHCSMISFLIKFRRDLDKDLLIELICRLIKSGVTVEDFDYQVILQSNCPFKYELLERVIEVSPYHLPFFNFLTFMGMFLDLQEVEDLVHILRFSMYTCSPKAILLFAFDEFSGRKYDEFSVRVIYSLLQDTVGQSVYLPRFQKYVARCNGPFSPDDVALNQKVERILSESSSVPLLLELTRDFVRKKIIRCCKCTLTTYNGKKGNVRGRNYHFCTKNFLSAIQILPLPKILKDVLLYKVPIYNYDYLERS